VGSGKFPVWFRWLRATTQRSRQAPPFRADPRASPGVQSDRIRLLLRLSGVKAFVWIRLQNPGFRDPACGELRAAANGEHGLGRMPDGTRRHNVHITTLLSLCLCVYQTRLSAEEGWGLKHRGTEEHRGKVR